MGWTHIIYYSRIYVCLMSMYSSRHSEYMEYVEKASIQLETELLMCVSLYAWLYVSSAHMNANEMSMLLLRKNLNLSFSSTTGNVGC